MKKFLLEIKFQNGTSFKKKFTSWGGLIRHIERLNANYEQITILIERIDGE